MLRTLTDRLESLQNAGEEPTKDEIHEWKSHPVTKALFAQAAYIYQQNAEVLIDNTPADLTAQLTAAVCQGEINICEQIIDMGFVDETD